MAHYEVEQGKNNNRVYLFFNEKPSADIRSELMSSGWKYHGYNRYWSSYDSKEHREQAKRLCEIVNIYESYYGQEEDEQEYDDEVLCKLNNIQDAKYYTLEEFNELADWRVCKSESDVHNKYSYTTKSGNYIECDSKSELKMWQYLEDNDLIIDGGGQKICIEYNSYFKTGLRYFPDMVVLTKLNHIAIIEVKAVTAMDYHKNIEKYKALIHYCEENGYEYMMIDPDHDFMSFNELLDFDLPIWGLFELFDCMDEDDEQVFFSQEDVDEWYEEYGEGYKKQDFYLAVHGLIAFFGWYNKYKNGFKFSNKPTYEKW